MVITQEHLWRALASGACKSGLPKVGADVAQLTADQAEWACDNALVFPDELALLQPEALLTGMLPFWAMYGDGYGDGSGYG